MDKALQQLRAQLAALNAQLEGTLTPAERARLQERRAQVQAQLRDLRASRTATAAEARLATFQLELRTEQDEGVAVPGSRLDRALDRALAVLAWEAVVALAIAVAVGAARAPRRGDLVRAPRPAATRGRPPARRVLSRRYADRGSRRGACRLADERVACRLPAGSGAGGGSSMMRARRLTAMRPTSSSGWWMVVIAGIAICDTVVSSKPTTERSSGIRRPRARASWSTATAISSLHAKMAVGRSGRSRSCAAAALPSTVRNSPHASSVGSGRMPAADSVAR